MANTVCRTVVLLIIEWIACFLKTGDHQFVVRTTAGIIIGDDIRRVPDQPGTLCSVRHRNMASNAFDIGGLMLGFIMNVICKATGSCKRMAVHTEEFVLPIILVVLNIVQ